MPPRIFRELMYLGIGGYGDSFLQNQDITRYQIPSFDFLFTPISNHCTLECDTRFQLSYDIPSLPIFELALCTRDIILLVVSHPHRAY